MRTTIFALAFSSLVTAGPINPPAGPVAPTGTTLGEIEPGMPINRPTTITAPGRYYLTNDINATGDAIIINASDVTLDLKGFAIIGDPQLDDANGIDVRAGAAGVRISGGTVRAFDGAGIEVGIAAEVIIDNMRARNCGEGFLVRGAARISDSTARLCSLGFRFLGDATSSIVVSRCSADGCGSGFSGSFASVEDCSATANTVYGFDISSGSIDRSRAINNGSTGFRLFDARGADLYAKLNALLGISANRSMVLDSDVIDSPTGVVAGGFSSIERCKVIGTAQPGTLGVDANGSAKIIGCHISNAPTAIDAANDTVVVGNTIFRFPGRTTADMIFVRGGAVVGLELDFTGGAIVTSGNPWANIIY